MDINYRMFQWEDLEQLIPMICQTWNLDNLFGSLDAGLGFSREYLYDVLQEATTIYVAESNKKILGLLIVAISAKNKIEIPIQYKNKLLKQPDAEVKVYKKVIQNYKRNCLSLLQRSQLHFDGEIILFIVLKEHQKQGIGTALFTLARQVFQQEKCQHYFLYTDTSCDYHYYEHHGLKCLMTLKPNEQEDFELFLYSENISK